MANLALIETKRIKVHHRKVLYISYVRGTLHAVLLDNMTVRVDLKHYFQKGRYLISFFLIFILKILL
jgi:hypothetical protein